MSVHAAFDKAAHYFGMKLIHIPLDKKTMKVDVKVLLSGLSKTNRHIFVNIDKLDIYQNVLVIGNEEGHL